MRHHRGSIVRLVFSSPIALLVALGLLFVPVECSHAAGPHSIFIAADAVASLQEQHAAHDVHAHGPAGGAHAGHAALDGDESACLAPEPASPPETAELVTYGLVAAALLGSDAGQRATTDLLQPLTGCQIPRQHLLPGPEPPPP